MLLHQHQRFQKYLHRIRWFSHCLPLFLSVRIQWKHSIDDSIQRFGRWNFQVIVFVMSIDSLTLISSRYDMRREILFYSVCVNEIFFSIVDSIFSIIYLIENAPNVSLLCFAWISNAIKIEGKAALLDWVKCFDFEGLIFGGFLLSIRVSRQKIRISHYFFLHCSAFLSWKVMRINTEVTFYHSHIFTDS